MEAMAWQLQMRRNIKGRDRERETVGTARSIFQELKGERRARENE